MMDFSVGMSRNWDGFDAGEEVAIRTLEKLEGNPKFLLLFSTYHYLKNREFEKILEGVHTHVSPKVPLIGGSIAGFITREGCYTRGVSAMSSSYENMDVAVGIGRNTKLTPQKAGRDCAEQIKNELKYSKFKQKFFITIISAAEVPNLPLIGKKKVVNVFGINFFLKFFNEICALTQIGIGRDDTVFDSFSKELEGFIGIGGASCDNLSMEKNRQFFMNSVVSNSIVSIGVSCDKEIIVNTSFGLSPYGKKFKIDKLSGGGYVLEKINNQPAVEEYLNIMGWTRDVLDERLYRKVFYYPFVQENSKKLLQPKMLALVYGNKFVCAAKPIENKSAEIYISSGNSLLKSINDLFTSQKCNSAFLVSCGTRLETLGANAYLIKDLLDKKIKGDYLTIYVGGEYSKLNESERAFMYQSDNAILLP